MLLAQAMGEYGGTSGGILGIFAGAVSSAHDWVTTSWAQDQPLWIGGGVCLLVVFWLFRR